MRQLESRDEEHGETASPETLCWRDELGPMLVQIWHEENPCPWLRQALWWQVDAISPRRSQIRCAETVLRVESRGGALHCLRFTDLDVPIKDILPALDEALLSFNRWNDVVANISRGWLVPPIVRGKLLHEASVQPQQRELEDSLQCIAWRAMPTGFAADRANDRLPGTPLASGRVATAFAEIARRFLERSTFATLAPVPMVLTQSDGTLTCGVANQILQWKEPCRTRRLQALTLYPWLWRELGLDLGQDEPDLAAKRRWQDLPKLKDAIDQGLPLLRHLSATYGVGPSTIRSLSAVPLCVRANPARLQWIAWTFDALPREWRPSLEDGNSPVRVLLDWFEELELLQDRSLAQRIAADIFGNNRKGFQRLWAICQQYHDPGGSLFDYAALWIRAKLNDKRRRPKDALQRALRDVILKVGLMSLVERSLGAFAPHITYEPKGHGAKWPARLDRPVRTDDRIVMELVDQVSLQAEGNAMQHCVSSLWRECVQMQSAVFSIRNLEGRRCSTLQLSAGDAAWELREHRAARNNNPEPACVRAAQEVLNFLNGAVVDGGA